MSMFSDRLHNRISKVQSPLVAGLDPHIEDFPQFLKDACTSRYQNNEDLIYAALTTFYADTLEAIAPHLAGIKPNIAFFEQYGIGGLRAFQDLADKARALDLLVIADVKRGDIGSTALAYSSAFLGKPKAFQQEVKAFEADAMTINPYLGFDTVEAYLKDCVDFGKGIFVLVKTSNPGSAQIQDLRCFGAGEAFDKNQGSTVSEHVAKWLAEKADLLRGNCGLSGLGAVVGATYPAQAKKLREMMPTNFFLVPGMGAQGASAKDALSGFNFDSKTKQYQGGIINASRGLFGNLPSTIQSGEDLRKEVLTRAQRFTREIREACSQ